MKKFFILCVTAALSISSAFAQGRTTKKVSWSLQAGANLSTFSASNPEMFSTSSRLGLTGGLSLNIRLINKLYIQPSFLYSSVGSEVITNVAGLKLTNDYKLNYFSLPLLAKYQFSPHFAILAGPQVDVMFSASAVNKETEFKSSVTNDFKENNFSATGGIEITPGHCVSFTGRYMHGLNNILNNSITTTTLKNRGFVLTLGVKL